MECLYSNGTSEHGVSKPICQKNFQSSPPKPFMGRLKLFKNAFKPTIAEDVTSFKNYPGWILGYKGPVKQKLYLIKMNRIYMSDKKYKTESITFSNKTYFFETQNLSGVVEQYC